MLVACCSVLMVPYAKKASEGQLCSHFLKRLEVFFGKNMAFE
jgi:hypothetical protein